MTECSINPEFQYEGVFGKIKHKSAVLWDEMQKIEQPYRDSHLDGFILKPTIYINGEAIIKEGHLTILDTPEVREVAAKYGDPDELLTEAGPA